MCHFLCATEVDFGVGVAGAWAINLSSPPSALCQCLCVAALSFGVSVAGAWVADLFSPSFMMCQCLCAAEMGFGVGGAVYGASGRVVEVFGCRGCLYSAMSR